jgi:hypothetical protein
MIALAGGDRRSGRTTGAVITGSDALIALALGNTPRGRTFGLKYSGKKLPLLGG